MQRNTFFYHGKRVVMLFIIVFCSYIVIAHTSNAETIDQLKVQIKERSENIQALEKEIAGYQVEINSLNEKEQSLSNTIKELDLTKKKLEANISLIQNKILDKTYEIDNLSKDISLKSDNIEDDRRIIKQTLVSVSQKQNQNMIEQLLDKDSLGAAWDSFQKIGNIQSRLISNIKSLNDAKTNLEANKKASQKAKNDLVSLNNQLAGERKAVLATVNEKNALLKDTQQSEASYTKLLSIKKSLKDSFEKEISSLELELKIKVDASKLPHTGTGILAWPLDTVKITQYFGNTPFATANPQIYNGAGHTGVDFKASIGTPIKASLSGVVIGVANTDIVRSCYSYGKWIMIKHANGLSTLYAHLSVQSVSIGEQVSTGQILGYSGNTGYTTGPHLHFGVYASDGVQITKLTSSTNCRGVTIPLADRKAYLNPLSYL